MYMKWIEKTKNLGENKKKNWETIKVIEKI